MATYTPVKFALPNGFDEVGYDFSLKRFPEETLDHFRQRLLQEARAPAGAGEDEFIRSLNRQVGELDLNVLQVDLVLDTNDEPLAPDPFIEVTSTHLRAYADYDNSVLDFEHNLVDRSDGYFLRDIEAAFTASTYFTVDVLLPAGTYEYKYARHLRYGDTEKLVLAESLDASRSNRLNYKYVKAVKAQSFQLFQNEVNSVAELIEPGDFYIDYLNGIIFTQDVASGFVSYTYREFPYLIAWQPVRAYPANDKDIDYKHKDTLIDDSTGLSEHLSLNSEGAKINNNILQIHSLGWGK